LCLRSVVLWRGPSELDELVNVGGGGSSGNSGDSGTNYCYHC
jgi:hypothetical protein